MRLWRIRSHSGTFEELLLELSLCNLNLNRLIHLFVVSALVVGIVLDGGGEERVDEGRLSQARLASNLNFLVCRLVGGCAEDAYHDGEGSTALGDNLVPVLR